MPAPHAQLRLAAIAAVAVASLASTAAGAAMSRPVRDPRPAPWVVYQASPSVRLVRLDGSDDHPLTAEPAGDQQHPDWSPDGTRVAFDHDFASLWVVGVDGSDPHEVYACSAPCAFIQDPAWSPDGRSLAFTRVIGAGDGENQDHAEVALLDLASGRTRVITAMPVATDISFSPRWSPDGRRLVYEVARFVDTGLSTTETTAQWLETVSLRSGRRRALGPRDVRASQPDWGRRGIVFSVGEQFTDDDMNLIVVRPDGRHRRALTRLAAPAGRAFQATWTPDDRGVIFTFVADGRWEAPTAGLVDRRGRHLRTDTFGGAEMTHARVQPRR